VTRAFRDEPPGVLPPPGRQRPEAIQFLGGGQLLEAVFAGDAAGRDAFPGGRVTKPLAATRDSIAEHLKSPQGTEAAATPGKPAPKKR